MNTLINNPMFSRFRKQAFSALALCIFACSLAHAVFLHWNAPSVPYDDAFITFRYVSNFHNGDGFVYNPGERVQGVSTPLFGAWLSLIKTICPSVDLPVLAVRGNAMWFLIAIILLVMFVYDYSRSLPFSLLWGSVCAAQSKWLSISLGGMESYMAVALIFLATFVLSREKFLFFGVLAGLSVLARPEGVLLLSALVIIGKRLSLRSVARVIAGMAVPLLVYGFPAWLYYGNPVPQSILSKAAGLYPIPIGDAAKNLALVYGDILFGERMYCLGDWRAISAGVIAVVLLVYISTHRFKPTNLRMLATFNLAALLFYGISNPLFFPWYTPLIALPFFAALPGIFNTMRHDSPNISRKSQVMGRWLQAILLILMAFHCWDTWRLKHSNYSASNMMPIYNTRNPARIFWYTDVGGWLATHYPQSWTVCAPEIGALGFTWHGKILDSCGLVSPEAQRYFPVSPLERSSPYEGVVPRKLVQDLNPELIASLPNFIDESLLPDPWFQANYRRLISADQPDAISSVQVFIRHDLCPETKTEHGESTSK